MIMFLKPNPIHNFKQENPFYQKKDKSLVNPSFWFLRGQFGEI